MPLQGAKTAQLENDGNDLDIMLRVQSAEVVSLSR